MECWSVWVVFSRLTFTGSIGQSAAMLSSAQEAKGLLVIASMILPEVIAVFSSFVMVVIDLTSEPWFLTA